MNDNAPRSICLAILMIASIAVPLFDAHSEPPELRDTPVKMEGTINGGSCTGHDACRGTDAGNTYATAINLTSDFDFDGTNETNIYFGSHPTATAYSSTSDTTNDFFIVDAPPGYGVTATLTWNHSGQGSYIFAETYAYRLHMGPTAMLGDFYTDSSSYGGAWAYCYYSHMGELKMTTEDWEMYEGNPSTGTGYCNKASSSYTTYTDTPHDLAGETMMIGVSCYYCYQNSYDDYQLEITVWPGDAGLPGDQVVPLSGAPIAEIGGGWYWGTPYWSSVSDTFTISAGQSFDLNYECDYWCPMETAASLTAPNGTSYSWGVGSLASYSSGVLGSYSGAGTWTLAATDSGGDGGIVLSAAEALGSFTGLLTADGFNPEDRASGNVGSSDTSDVWAMQILALILP